MDVIVWLAGGVLLGVGAPAAIFLLRRRDAAPAPARRSSGRASARNGSSAAARPPRNRYAAVRIEPGLVCCELVQSYKDQRFLGHDVPALPLPDCPQASSCRCTYRHLSDRRSGDDRRLPFSTLSFGVAPESLTKRSGDRRSDD